MLPHAEVVSECSLVTIYEGRVLKVLMWSIKRERAWEWDSVSAVGALQNLATEINI